MPIMRCDKLIFPINKVPRIPYVGKNIAYFLYGSVGLR